MILSQRIVLLVLLVASTVTAESNHSSSSSSSSSSSICSDDGDDDDDDQTCKQKQKQQQQNVDNEPFCGVYMAPSTIGVANMGIYTNMDLQKGDVVNFPDIAIPLLFRDWAYHGDNPDGMLWDRYIWDGPVANIEPKRSDLDREDAGAVFIPGVGCTVNSRLEMNNIYSTHGSIYDTAGLHRSRDPGSGAFSPYHSSQTTAKFSIKAGNELFAAYGDHWIPEIPGAIITFNENMDNADEFLDEYAARVSEMKNDGLTPEMAESLWNLTAKEFPYASHILGALPQQEYKVVEAELQQKTEPSTTRHFVRQIGVQTTEWLKENGKCQDHIRSHRSTIAQAGRGAFASRPLPKGTVVGYAPLVHIGNAREILKINYELPGGKTYSQEDLIINYSFGHKNSTMILTPYGAMVSYINHHRERANVKVQWPDKELIAHKPEWLSMNVEFFSNTHEKIGLSFDYVALRDLEEGEELFMDYGDEWIAAWDAHVAKYTPEQGSETYKHSTEWTETYLRTREELSATPYPKNLATLCFPSYKSDGSGGFTFIPILRKGHDRVYCDVLTREVLSGNDRYQYTVIMHLGHGPVTISNVTQEGIQLVDRIQSADWHMEGAFRHEMAVPDDVFPDAWKNRM